MCLLSDFTAALGPAHVLQGAGLARYSANLSSDHTAAAIFALRPVNTADVALPLDKLAEFLAKIHAGLPDLDSGAESLLVVHLVDEPGQPPELRQNPALCGVTGAGAAARWPLL